MSVRVEGKALIDPRLGVLGKLLGTSRHDALGRMVMVWHYCTEQHVYNVPCQILGELIDGDPAHLVNAGLAEQCPDGSFRIRGTEGRIEWKERLRQSAQRGGKARAAESSATRQDRAQPPGRADHENSSATRQSPITKELSAPTPTPIPSPIPITTPTTNTGSDHVARPSPPSFSPESDRVAAYLETRILAHSPEAKTQPGLWSKDIDKAIRIDGRTAAQLMDVIDFAHTNAAGEFWKANILSGKKLRDKYDTLRLQMERAKGGSGRMTAADTYRMAQELEKQGL